MIPTSSKVFWNRNCTFECNYVSVNANLPHLFLLVCMIILLIFLNNDVHNEYILIFKRVALIFLGVEMH